MKISVITTSFNSGGHILRNIESVNRQTHPDVEHLFIDNTSTDGTLEIIARSAKRSPVVVSEKDRGISDAFNKGIRRASGKIIAILNSDDEFFSPDALARVDAAFEKDPDLEFVHGDILFVDEVHGTNIRRPLLCPITEAMPYNHPAFFVRKSFYEKLGLFDETYRYAMDFELISRMYDSPGAPRLKGLYLAGEPLSIMHAGGASWKYEMRSLGEVRRGLEKNSLLTAQAVRTLTLRRFRIGLKFQLSKVGLDGVVKLWRKLKWSKPSS